MFRGGNPLLEKDTTTFRLKALLGSSLIGQLPSERLIPNQATVTLSAHPWWATTVRKVHPHRATAMDHLQSGNYRPECSSSIGLLDVCLCSEEGSPHDSSITGQLPSRRFISG